LTTHLQQAAGVYWQCAIDQYLHRSGVYKLLFFHAFLLIFPKVKVKCTFVQALTLCTGRTARRGSRGIALLFHDQRN